jgi:NADP-dependent 3-hydroxy acid dehydrogenase YdfG
MFITARNAESLAKLKEELENTYNVPVATAVLDVKSEESIKAGVEAAVKAFGRIDVVICNGGSTYKVMKRLIEVNLLAGGGEPAARKLFF